jgi:hypothetical protein
MKDLVHQGRFAMVNVGYDRYVSDFHNSIVANGLRTVPPFVLAFPPTGPPVFGGKSTPKRRDFLVKPVLTGWFAEI